ncbi:MAG TPA: SIS domain-containing protein [Caulobacteraceae bacterium]
MSEIQSAAPAKASDDSWVGKSAGFLETHYDELRRRLSDAPGAAMDDVCQRLAACRARGNKVIVAGNGGSAAIASHAAVDMVKMLRIRAMNFNEADLITCFANDYGYENWVAEGLKAHGDKGDVAVLISSSGQSANITNAAKQARALGMEVITLSGFKADNPLRALGDVNLWCDSQAYNIVENVHQVWLLSALDRLALHGPKHG